MPHCMVPGCTNHSNKATGVSYHRLPQNERRRKIWLAKTPRKNPCPSQYSFVCSDHFSPDSFVQDLAEELCGCEKRRRLTAGAVPTMFPQTSLHSMPRKPRPASERRSQKWAEQEILQEIISAEPGPSTNIRTEPDVDIPAAMECTDQEMSQNIGIQCNLMIKEYWTVEVQTDVCQGFCEEMASPTKSLVSEICRNRDL